MYFPNQPPKFRSLSWDEIIFLQQIPMNLLDKHFGTNFSILVCKMLGSRQLPASSSSARRSYTEKKRYVGHKRAYIPSAVFVAGLLPSLVKLVHRKRKNLPAQSVDKGRNSHLIQWMQSCRWTLRNHGGPLPAPGRYRPCNSTASRSIIKVLCVGGVS